MKFYKLVSVCTALILSCSSTIFNFKADANARIIHPISFANRLQVNMSNCKAYYSPTYANSYGEKQCALQMLGLAIKTLLLLCVGVEFYLHQEPQFNAVFIETPMITL